jgi:HAMP domain-containing protein
LEQEMGLRLKFNIVLAITLVLGLVTSSIAFWWIAEDNARQQLHAQMRLLRAQALSVRKYTLEEIRPLLADQSDLQFLPQTVPSFAAQAAFNNFREQFPNFFYKEAALNPTNPADQAVGWEKDLIGSLREELQPEEIVRIRSTPNGDHFTVAFPLKVTSKDCLSCHSKPETAPSSMVALYGDKNGFGWKLGETVGAQIFSAPLSGVREQILQSLLLLMGPLVAIFLMVIVLLNILLSRMVITPITRISKIAEEVSLGNSEVPEYSHNSRDEIASLSQSFNRMRRSLDNAMKMLED